MTTTTTASTTTIAYKTCVSFPMTGGDNERVNHVTAQERCEEIGGYLSYFLTEQELDQYNSERETLGRKEWLGIVLNQTSGVWETVTGK